MSHNRADEAGSVAGSGDVEQVIEPRLGEVGGFEVRRALPTRQRRQVGPFVFFDHMGPAEFAPGEGIQVRPHPHIGLSTVTYLFEGEIVHRDSLGSVQPIRAGAVNLMTAGRGIVHSERAGDDIDRHSRLHGIQTWMALPLDQQECDPDFRHYPAEAIPQLERDGATVRVIIGTAYGEVSPVLQHAPTLYLECRLPAGTHLVLPGDHEEIGAYLVDGALRVDGLTLAPGQLAVARPGATPRLEAEADSLVMAIGGANLGKRHVWWNFVAATRARVEQAGRDWRDGRFAGVPGDDEFIPLPE